jgi:hypothetical protein
MKILSTSLCALTLLSSVSHAELLMDNVEDRVSRSNETVTFIFSDLAVHDTVSLNFDFFMFDTWDIDNPNYNDTFAFSVDQHQMVYGPTAAAWGGNPQTNNELEKGAFNEYNYSGWSDIFFDDFMGGFTFAHSADTLTLSFTGSNLQSIVDESWAVDRVNLSTNSQSNAASVPVPLALGGLLLSAMLFGRKRT